MKTPIVALVASVAGLALGLALGLYVGYLAWQYQSRIEMVNARAVNDATVLAPIQLDTRLLAAAEQSDRALRHAVYAKSMSDVVTAICIRLPYTLSQVHRLRYEIAGMARHAPHADVYWRQYIAPDLDPIFAAAGELPGEPLRFAACRKWSASIREAMPAHVAGSPAR